jgi:uncharacterized protein (TIGR00369 family)
LQRLNALHEESDRLRTQRASLAAALLNVEGKPLGIPFLQHVGVESVRYTPGDTVLRLMVVDHLENSFHRVHGGVTMTLLDVAMAMAARSVLNSHLEVTAASETRGVVTVEMKANFLAPGTGALFARGRCLQRGASLLFCEGEVFGVDGSLIATSSGTFKAIRRSEVHPPHAV